MPLRSTAARIAAAPNSGALRLFRSPWKPPMGVRAVPRMTIGSLFIVSLRLFRGHAQRAVEADHLAVEHVVLDDLAYQRGILVRSPEARRKGHAGGQRIANFLGHAGHHRRFEHPGRDGHDPYAVTRQFA